MKKVRNLLFTLLMILSFSIIGAKTIYADAFTLTSSLLVCTPDSLKPGESADCYMIGVPEYAASAQNPSVNGYIVKAYTNGYLTLTGAKKTVTTNTGATFTTATSATSSPFSSSDSSMPAELKKYTCNYDSDGVSGTAHSFGCAAFYSKTTENAFTPTTIKQTGVNSSLLPNDSYGVIGAVTVKLDANTPAVDSCGEICVKIMRVPTAADYNNLSSCTNCGIDSKNTKNGYDCTEIHMTSTTTHNTETGAFASYALLAAGALVAISAITLAKKNKKIYKI